MELDMNRTINALVLEGRKAEGLRISDALAAEGVRVHVVDTCDKAMNKMLEYMDLVVVDSRAEGVASRSVDRIKSRVCNTPVVTVGSERELKSIRLQGRARADEYLSLTTGKAVAEGLLKTFRGSSRCAVHATKPRRRFSFAACI